MISFLIFYHTKDEHYLNECINSLPRGEELILIKTIQGQLPNDVMIPGEVKGKIKRYDYHYNELDFARMRNYGIKCCSQEWIFSIDPDERLLMHQHSGLMDMLHNMSPHVSAVGVHTISYCEHENNPLIGAHVFRLFRNRGIEYRFPVHEDIMPSVNEQNGQAINSDLLIHHVGYTIPKSEYIFKLKRNLEILNRYKLDEEPEEYVRERYKAYKNHMITQIGDK